MIFLIIFLSVLSACFYRAGGLDTTTKHWIPVWMRHSWVRDWLCPICALIPFLIINPSWWILLSYLLMAGALSTYWDFLFGYDNFWFAGFMVGLALFPLAFCGLFWWILLLKAMGISLAWGLVTKFSGNDFVEEYFRGFSVVLL